VSVRTQLRDLLADRVPDTWDVRADGRDVDAPEVDQPVLFVWTNRVTPGPTIGWRTHEFLLRICTPLTDPEQYDDDLDALLETLTDVLQGMDPIAWTEAVRGVHGQPPRLQCYTLTATVPARKDT
jgi:hypothetical protein